jgi:hypothetical protein
MMNFSYLCKHLAGTQPTKGNETGCPSCAKKHDTGDFCTPDSEVKATAAKLTCRDADFIKIPGLHKRKL